MIGFVVVIVILLLLFLVRPFTVIIHELGHAIPALLFTRENVDVYIGSYGESNQTFSLNIGRLSIFFKYIPFLWKIGLCSHSNNHLSFFKLLIIILGGPLISLVIGLSAFYVAVAYDLHGILKTLSFAIMLSAIFDFYINLYPDKVPIHLSNGSTIYNDGESLIRLIKIRSNLNGLVETPIMLNNRGYDYILKEAYETSIPYFDKAIEGNPNFAFAYNNRGLARIKIGLLEEGLKDVEKSLVLNERNAYAWRNLGVYFLEINDVQKAYKYFQKAERLESGIPLLNNLLEQTRPQ